MLIGALGWAVVFGNSPLLDRLLTNWIQASAAIVSAGGLGWMIHNKERQEIADVHFEQTLAEIRALPPTKKKEQILADLVKPRKLG